MRSTDSPEPGRLGLRWTWAGVVVMTVVAVALLRVDGTATRVVVGAALAVCLAMVAMMVWLDRRDARSTERSDRRS